MSALSAPSTAAQRAGLPPPRARSATASQKPPPTPGGTPDAASARTTLVGAPPGPAAAFGSVTGLDTAPNLAAPATVPTLEDGFGDDAEPGSPLSALAQAMSAPTPAAAAAASYADEASAQATTIPDGAAEILDDDFVIPRQPNALQNLIAIITGSRRNIAIAAGAAGLLVLVSALAFCGGGSSSKRKQVAASETTANGSAMTGRAEPALEPAPAAKPAPSEPVAPAPAAPTEPEASGPTAEELAASAQPAEPTEPTDTAPPTGGGTTAAQPKRDTGKATTPTTAAKTASTTGTGGKQLGGKQVVLEYDTQARESKPVASAPKSDQAAIQKARSAYASGNQRLFAGDPSGAIKFYRQSLGFYPGYVAGYRGLGLAYAQQGDKPKALQALRMYVSSVPTAKDAPLIRKRISSLQGK